LYLKTDQEATTHNKVGKAFQFLLKRGGIEKKHHHVIIIIIINIVFFFLISSSSLSHPFSVQGRSVRPSVRRPVVG